MSCIMLFKASQVASSFQLFSFSSSSICHHEDFYSFMIASWVRSEPTSNSNLRTFFFSFMRSDSIKNLLLFLFLWQTQGDAIITLGILTWALNTMGIQPLICHQIYMNGCEFLTQVSRSSIELNEKIFLKPMHVICWQNVCTRKNHNSIGGISVYHSRLQYIKSSWSRGTVKQSIENLHPDKCSQTCVQMGRTIEARSHLQQTNSNS